MCKLCLRTPVNHLSGLYTSQEGELDRGSEGHPQTPAKGAVPLWTPSVLALTRHCEPQRSNLGQRRGNGASWPTVSALFAPSP